MAFAFAVVLMNPVKNPVPLLVIAYTVRRLPYLTRSALAGLQQIAPVMEEAAENLGASRWRVLRTVTVPKGPHGLVVTPDGRKVYVSSDGASTVSVAKQNCQSYHLCWGVEGQFSGPADPGTHCPHAEGGGPCAGL